jgi:hypothetical protein
MKNLVKYLVLIVIIIPAYGVAQNNALDEYIKTFQGTPGFYFLDVKTNMFNLDEGESKNNKMIDLQVVSFEKTENAKFNPKKVYKEFNKSLDKDLYRGLVEVKSSGENVHMLVKKEGDLISEIIFMIEEENETTFLMASGTFDLEDITKLGEIKDCKGFQTLGKLCEE